MKNVSYKKIEKMNDIFSTSENANINYTAKICRIEELHDIDGADRLKRTIVDGYDIIVDNSFSAGDMVVYFPVECVINRNFLSLNNLFCLSDYSLNSNCQYVTKLLINGDEKSAKENCGFFKKQGRVKCIKLRGYPSEGFVTQVKNMERFNSKLSGYDWSRMEGVTFDTVDGEKICWKYVRPIKNNAIRSNEKSTNKRLKKFDRIVPEQFKFHYDTQKINPVMKRFTPDDDIVISVKVHGTSAVIANVLCNKKLNFFERIKKSLGFKVIDKEFGNVYSSRKTIKNADINPNVNSFYECDVWGLANRLIMPYLGNGMTVYGEIVGYQNGTNKMIQELHDYGCEVGEWKFMPYRITLTDENGVSKDKTVREVYEWTMDIRNKLPFDERDKIMPINILYDGRFGDLYPDIEEDEDWAKNMLKRLKNDKEFFMEEKEPLCNYGRDEYNKEVAILNEMLKSGASKRSISKQKERVAKKYDRVPPREGLVFRINNDSKAEAWKLKTDAHYNLETILLDEGVEDIEENETI